MNYAKVCVRTPKGTGVAVIGFKCAKVREEFFKENHPEIEGFEFLSCRRAKELAKSIKGEIQVIKRLRNQEQKA